MSFSVQVGLFLALLCAVSSIFGYLYKHRGATDSPPVELSRPISSSLALFRNRWYVLGIVVATGSWGFHVAALALAPISLVQSVIAGGLALLTVVADRVFGLEVTRREWIGVALAAIGLAVLAATLDGAGDEKHSDYANATLITYVGMVTTVGLLAAYFADRVRAHAGVILGASAGLLWGASDVSIKALSDSLSGDGLLVLVHPLALVILLLSLIGLSVSARSFQLGEAVATIAVTSAMANISTIASGPIVFGEPLPEDTAGLVLRMLAFSLVIFAAVLIPAPVRVAEIEPAA